MSVCGTGVLRPLVKEAATQIEPEGSDDDFDIRVKTHSKAIILPASHQDGELNATPTTTNKAHTCRQNSISGVSG